jgi:hypothetical protein
MPTPVTMHVKQFDVIVENLLSARLQLRNHVEANPEDIAMAHLMDAVNDALDVVDEINQPVAQMHCEALRRAAINQVFGI